MTTKAHPRKRAARRRRQPWVPWAVLALATVTLAVLASGPGHLLAYLQGLTAPRPQGPLNLTILHTNDTWGFAFPCG